MDNPCNIAQNQNQNSSKFSTPHKEKSNIASLQEKNPYQSPPSNITQKQGLFQPTTFNSTPFRNNPNQNYYIVENSFQKSRYGPLNNFYFPQNSAGRNYPMISGEK